MATKGNLGIRAHRAHRRGPCVVIVNDDWAIELVLADNWYRTGELERPGTRDRLHIVARSLRAAAFLNLDSFGDQRTASVTGLNLGWITSGPYDFLRAYRVPSYLGRRWARQVIKHLSAQMSQETIGTAQPQYIWNVFKL